MNLRRVLTIGLCCLSGGMAWGLVGMVIARKFTSISEEAAIVYVGLPILIACVVVGWRPVERALVKMGNFSDSGDDAA